MKKSAVLILVIVAVLTVSNTACAAVTLSFEETFGSNGAAYHSADLRDVKVINLAYLKQIKIDLDYLYGEYVTDERSHELKWENSQIGYPVLNYPQQLLYITLGESKYSEFVEYPADSGDVLKTYGIVLGIDYVRVLSNQFQIELTLQQSINGSARFTCFDLIFGKVGAISDADLTIGKIKLRYLLTDDLGLTLNYRLIRVDIEDSRGGDPSLKYSSLGLIYRF